MCAWKATLQLLISYKSSLMFNYSERHLDWFRYNWFSRSSVGLPSLFSSISLQSCFIGNRVSSFACIPQLRDVWLNLPFAHSLHTFRSPVPLSTALRPRWWHLTLYPMPLSLAYLLQPRAFTGCPTFPIVTAAL